MKVSAIKCEVCGARLKQTAPAETPAIPRYAETGEPFASDIVRPAETPAPDPLMAAGFDHPCKDTCSGWRQGYERGRYEASGSRESTPKCDDEGLFKKAIQAIDFALRPHRYQQGLPDEVKFKIYGIAADVQQPGARWDQISTIYGCGLQTESETKVRPREPGPDWGYFLAESDALREIISTKEKRIADLERQIAKLQTQAMGAALGVGYVEDQSAEGRDAGHRKD